MAYGGWLACWDARQGGYGADREVRFGVMLDAFPARGEGATIAQPMPVPSPLKPSAMAPVRPSSRVGKEVR